jgi:hypothetical protein
LAVRVTSSFRKAGGALPLAIIGLPFFLLGGFFFLAGIGWFVGLVEGDLVAAIMGILIGGIFALIGGAMLWGVVRSFGPESARPQGSVLGSGTGREGWAAFPRARTHGRGSRGGTLLRAEVTRGMAVIGLLIAAIIWNGISWVAFWAVTFEDKSAPCFVKGMIWAFCGIGILLFLGFFGQLFSMIRWKSTRVEVQKELLRPGESTRVTVAQAGDFAIQYLRLTVVAQESATYRVGTNSRTQTEELWSEVILDRTELRARGDRPIAEAELHIPPEAMHSFHGSNNRIQWLLRLEMDAPGRPAIKEEYRFRVAPEVAR